MTPRLLVFVALIATTAHADDWPHGQLSREVVPQRYDLTFNIDPRQAAFTGLARIDVHIAAPMRRIWLHGLGLRVAYANLRAGGRDWPLTWTAVDGVHGVARLDSAETLPAGAATIRISYAADFQAGMSGIGRIVVGDESCAMTQMEPIDARRAFPGFDDPQFWTPFSVTVVTRDGDRVIANAPLEESHPLGGGLVRLRFAPTPPLPPYLVALAVGPLDVVEGRPIPARSGKRAPIPQRAVATRGNGSKLDYVLAHTADIVLALEDYFGPPYPYAKLDQIASPQMPGAMENAGAVTYADNG